MSARSAWGSLSYNPKTKTGYIRYMAKGPKGYKRYTKTVHGTRIDCELARLHLLEQHKDDGPAPTVGAMFEEHYLPRKTSLVEAGELTKTTLGAYERQWRLRIAPRWKDVPVDEVRPYDVQRWVGTLGGTSPQFAIPVFKAVMNYAVKYGYIATNPLDEKYDLPSKASIKRLEDGLYDHNELLELWRASVNTPLEAFILLSGFGSCRVGEALAIRADRIVAMSGLDVPVIAARIEAQVDEYGRVKSTTKTPESRRWIVVAGDPARRIERISKSLGGAYLVDGGTGSPVPQRVIRKELMNLARKIGMTPHYPKSLRKTWETTARWVLRIPEVYTEPMMGHVIPDVTGMHYDAPTKEDFARILAKHYSANPYADHLDWLKELL